MSMSERERERVNSHHLSLAFHTQIVPYLRVSASDSAENIAGIIRQIYGHEPKYDRYLSDTLSRMSPSAMEGRASLPILARLPVRTPPRAGLTSVSLILSITGGATSLMLPKDLESAIRKGLLRATSNTAGSPHAASARGLFVVCSWSVCGRSYPFSF